MIQEVFCKLEAEIKWSDPDFDKLTELLSGNLPDFAITSTQP